MRRLLGVALASVALAACGSGGGPSPSASPTTAQRPSSPAAIEIVEPQPGQMVGSDVTVRVELTGAQLIEEVTTDIRPDQGHIHLKLDGETITLLAGLDESIPGVATGTHLLEVEFVAGDHGPFNPRIIKTVSFEVA